VARETLVVERRGAKGEVAVWTLSRPEAKNALDSATFASLGRALADARDDGTLRAIVLTGAGGTFVSGGDLRELRAATTTDDAARLADAGRDVCDAIARLAVPVIAALPGAAIGGGAELATACDLRVADERATVCFKHARMAVTTAWGILPKLVGMVGHGAATRLVLAATEVDAREALRLGLVDAVTQDGGCVELAVAWGLEVAKGAPLATAALKALLRDAVDPTADVRAAERARFVATWTSADHAEAVEAFFERRAPEWAGR
jgi:enoyl-CoA hydratase/carnithine racemase